MSRWIGSLLIAAISSVVTLLLAWSSLGPPTAKDNTVAAQSGTDDTAAVADDQVKLPGETTAEMLQQLAMLDDADQGDQGARINSADRPPKSFNDRGPDRHIAPPMTPRNRLEYCERCNEVANDIDPSLARRLAALREQDPAEFERNMRLFGRKLFAMAELKQRDPDLYAAKLNELRNELTVRQRAHDLREARAAGHKAQAEAHEAALRSALQIQLAMTIKARAELVCRLEEQVKQIRAEIDEQASHFNETIEQRFQALVLGPPQPLASGGAGANSAQPMDLGATSTPGKD